MSARADRVVDALSQRELDALVVTYLPNVRWLTGYTGSSGLAVIGRDVRRFITDSRYELQAQEQVPAEFAPGIVRGELLASVHELLGDPTGRVGFDDDNLSVRAHRRLGESLSGVELVAAGGIVEDLRSVKDAREVAQMRAACELADTAVLAVVEDGLIGRTEAEIALAIEFEQRRLGASRASFPTIVASGPHGALPHAEPRDVEIERDVLVTIDFGARLEGYCSDCTRTFATGDGVAEAALEAYAVVLEAQQLGLDTARAGLNGREVDAPVRELIAAAGHGDHYGHGLGHGVGLEIHEAPRLSPLAPDDPLLAGQVVSVEPGIYVPGEFGIRIEDLVVLGDDGATILTTGIPKELTVV